MTFASTLKKWRKDNNLMQKNAADRLGVLLRTYQRWEAGTKPAKTCQKCIEQKMELPIL